MEEDKVNAIMDAIFEDSSLVIIREALTSYNENTDDVSRAAETVCEHLNSGGRQARVDFVNSWFLDDTYPKIFLDD